MVTVRRMELKDIGQVHEIDQLSFSMPWPERSYRFELTENRSTRCWVAEVTEPGKKPQVQAMLVMWVIIDEGHIGTFAVHPEARRRGLGRKLLARALQEATREGLTRVFLEVRRTNESAQKLYEQFGFKVEGVRRHYYRDNGEDAFLMTLDPVDEQRLEMFLK
jgi:ribosomal-protein-alanine N-acetyltransferase